MARRSGARGRSGSRSRRVHAGPSAAAVRHRRRPPRRGRSRVRATSGLVVEGAGGQSLGSHVDNALRQVTGTAHRIRTDLSCTLFLSGPDEYEGGELMVEDTDGVHSVKLPAGDLVLYPSTSLHHVRPVTSGARICSFFWPQSMVRSDADRTLLFDLDATIRSLHGLEAAGAAAVQLTGVYHNLLRRWAEV